MNEEVITTPYDGKAVRIRAEKESEFSDMKQHADKLYQGFKKLDKNDTKRAIWELFQNAIDISKECEIRIEERVNVLEFSHNGEFFNSNTLISLIKQVSSKPFKGAEEEDETIDEDKFLDQESGIIKEKKKVGQYGTGFITTHSFGRRIILNSYLHETGIIIPLIDFEIDRTCEPSKPSQLTRKLIDQRDKVFEIIEAGEATDSWEQKTTFGYMQETELQKKNVDAALTEIHSLLPLVMIFNSDLKKVIVKRTNDPKTTYQKQEDRIIKELQSDEGKIVYKTTTITKNNIPKEFFYLEYMSDVKELDPDIVVVLPLANETEVIEISHDIAKLFLFFPLIGSEDFGFNFIVHSNKFKCTEPRDGLYLKSFSDENNEDEKINQELLSKSTDIIFSFLKKHDLRLSNTIKLGKINFNRVVKDPVNENEKLLAEYFSGLQKQWVGNIKLLSIVDVNEGRATVLQSYFLSDEFLKFEDLQTFKSLYRLVTKFWSNVPKEEIAIEWSTIIDQWSDDSINYITIESLLGYIEEEGSLEKFEEDEEDLKAFYRYLIAQEKTSLFNRFKVLPNINNDFVSLLTAKSPLDIEEAFINVAKVLIPDITDKFINGDYAFTLPLETYDRDALNKDIKTKNNELNNDIQRSKVLDYEDLMALISYCSIFPKLENRGKRGEIVDLILDYHQQSKNFKEVPNINDKELDFTPVTRTLIKDTIYRLTNLTSSELEAQLNFLYKLLAITYDSYDYKETIQNLPAYPNQLNVLKNSNELSRDINILFDLKVLYNKIVFSHSKDIRSSLLSAKFNQVILTTNEKTGKSLSEEIYNKFFEAGSISEIIGHPYSDYILDIIKNSTDDPTWGYLFPEIYAERSVILMKKFTEDAVKDNLFKILVSGNEKIKILGELSQRQDLDNLIKLGEAAIEEEKRRISDFAHKKKIGVHIEDLIREKIDSEINLKVRINNGEKENIGVDEVQGGQDIIIEINDRPIFYVEVKSRWDSNNSVFMSRPQLHRAFQEKANYALCSVDMTKYKGNNRYNVETVDEIKEHTRFVDNIGNLVEPLVFHNIAAESTGDNVRLTDYRGLIPQEIISMGMEMNSFIGKLCILIESEILNAQPNQ